MNQSLPITSIERFHLFDDYPNFPNTIGCHLRLTGNLDIGLANRALRKTLLRHKMATALADDKFKRWHFDRRSIKQFVMEEIQPGENVVAVPINPKVQGGARFLWQPTDEGVRLLMVTHHAHSDGQGGIQFLIDWMIAYHNLSGGSKISLRKLDQHLLSKRNRLGVVSRAFLSKLWLQPIAIFGSVKFMARKIAALGEDAFGEFEESSDYEGRDAATNLSTVELSAGESELLREVAECEQRTVNDLLIRDIFLAVHEFRKDCNSHKIGEWLRIVIPMSIRSYSDRRMPAVNRATIVQLDRTDKDFADVDQLAWGINYELGNVRKWQLDKTFLLALRMFSRIPGRLKKVAQKNVCRATTVVTNLASPFDRIKLPRKNGKIKLGESIVEDFDLIAPLRPMTPVAIAVSKYAGVLKLSLHFHQYFFSRDDADLLVEHLVNQINRTLTSLDP